MPSDGRRAAAAHVLPGARAAHAPLGLRQPGVRLDARRHAHPVPLAPRRRGRCRSPGSTRSRRRAVRPSRCRCRTRAPATYSPDGKQVVYSPRFRDFRSEKRYGGGQANDLFIFDLASHDATRITDHPRADRDPMWIGDTIYFNSDRDGTFNLYAYDVAKKTTTQVTTSHDVGRALAERGRQAGRIVYESNGELQLLDTKSGKAAADRHHGARRRSGAPAQPHPGRHADPRRRAEPEGRAGAVRGARRHLHRADREGADAQPDALVGRARQVAALVAGRPAHRLHLRHVAARTSSTSSRRTAPASRRQLTKGGQALRYAPAWSPDGKRIAFGDKDGKLYVVTVADKTLTQIADAARGQIRDYTWSPRGHHLAFTMNGNERLQLGLRLEREGRPGPARHRSAVQRGVAGLGSRRQVPVLPERPRVRAAALDGRVQLRHQPHDRHLRAGAAQGRAHPFPPESDEVKIADEKKDEPKADEKKPDEKKPEAAADAKKDATPEDKKTTVPVPAASELVIDFDGLAARVMRVPLPADNYGGLSATKTGLIYTVARRRLLRPRQRPRALAAHLRVQGPQGDDAWCRDVAATRSRPTAARCSSRRAAAAGPPATYVRRDADRRRLEEDGLDGRPDGRPRAGRGVGADLRRSVAPLPRLLLRREHARLRLGGAARRSTSRWSRTSRTAPT